MNLRIDPAMIEGDPRSWINSLPSYQRISFEAFLEDGATYEDAAEMWLQSAGPPNTFPFGGDAVGGSGFFVNLLTEMQKLICDSKEYIQNKEEVAASVRAGKYAFAGAVALAVAPYVGVTAVVVTPAVVAILGVIFNAGHVTACEKLDEIIRRRGSAE